MYPHVVIENTTQNFHSKRNDLIQTKELRKIDVISTKNVPGHIPYKASASKVYFIDYNNKTTTELVKHFIEIVILINSSEHY